MRKARLVIVPRAVFGATFAAVVPCMTVVACGTSSSVADATFGADRALGDRSLGVADRAFSVADVGFGVADVGFGMDVEAGDSGDAEGG